MLARLHPTSRTLLLFATLWLLGFVVTMLRGVGLDDESWFLQVTARVATGETLYRDVFFGATPLSVWVAAACAKLIGTEILLQKVLVAACFAASVLLCLKIARALRLPDRGAPALVIAMLALAAPLPHALYQPLAALLFLVVLERALAWSRARRWSHLIGATLAASLCFATKQNVGALALGALVVTVLLEHARLAPAVLMLFVAASCALLAPVFASGAAQAFADYAFLNKKVYLRVAGVSYATQLSLSWASLPFFVPPIALLLVFTATLRSHAARREGIIISSFALAALASIYPRADTDHVIYIVAPMLIACWYGIANLRWRVAAAASRLASAVVLVIVLVTHVVLPAQRLATHDAVLASLPHFRGAIMTRHHHERLRASARALADATRDEKTFLLSRYAAFYYLAAGVKNPTPFDYPAVTTFGRRGALDLAHDLGAGRIAAVCMDNHWKDELSPEFLESYVVQTMRPGQATGAGVIYRR